MAAGETCVRFGKEKGFGKKRKKKNKSSFDSIFETIAGNTNNLYVHLWLMAAPRGSTKDEVVFNITIIYYTQYLSTSRDFCLQNE